MEDIARLVQPHDSAVTVQASGTLYVVTVTHRHPDGVRSFTCTATVPKLSRDLAYLEREALESTREWIAALENKLGT